MSWKDRWTAFCWKITFPGEPIPFEILPSNYARLPKPPEKLSLADALTQATIMDMTAYPKQWERKEAPWTYDDVLYINKSADVTVRFAGLNSTSCKINDVEVGAANREKLVNAFQNRHGAEVLERLVDRIEKVTTVTPEEVIEEVRPKTIDPFAPAPMETLATAIDRLKSAAMMGAQLSPPPLRIAAPSKTATSKALVPKAAFTKRELPNIKKPLYMPTTWKGKSSKKLNDKEYREMVEWMNERGHLQRR